mmetsp:Transcript_30044/g.54769  ORF Transcript_30044/g.54769 Transcript_30044/m.54769 type:complete len:475 (-) Transcript_30044:42-1466(-)
MVRAWLLGSLLIKVFQSCSAAGGACSAAGISRSAFRSETALEWLQEENSKRAPYYLRQARRLVKKAQRQATGADKSNSDPFIALYDAQHQVLAALDLDFTNASVWVGAGQATALIAAFSEDGQSKQQEALAMLAHAVELDSSSLQKILDWTSVKEEKEAREVTQVRNELGKSVKAWQKTGKPARKPSTSFIRFLFDRANSESCPSGAGKDDVDDSSPVEVAKDPVPSALAAMTVKPIFPTLITTVNVRKHMGSEFADRLADMAIKKYQSFTKEKRARGDTDPNDINDAFFSAQATGEGQHKSKQAQKFWPELYNSPEYQQLLQLMRGALFEHAAKTGYPVPDHSKRGASVVLWSAVYLSDGGRHGYHVHQGSLTSCVFYARCPDGKTPMMFIDPRGAPPTNDYEQHLGERDFEPVSPFHHNYNYFAEAGDIVCFPSWLVHRVPAHFEEDPRVAFPANLQADASWGPWYASATLP